MRVVFYLLLSIAYMLASGFRLSAGVVYPDLSVQLGMSAGMAGFTASLLFYAYALMQPVSGIVNSHFGPAKISAVGLFVAALGMMLMAHVSSVPQLALSRLLCGLGLAPIFSGLILYTLFAFPLKWQPILMGINFGLGHIGSMCSAAPLGYALDRWGMTMVFWGFALFSLFLVGMFLFLSCFDPVARDTAAKGRRISPRAIYLDCIKGFHMVVKSPGRLTVTIQWGVFSAALLSLQGLWGIPWAQQALLASEAMARNWTVFLSVGALIGTSCAGRVCLWVTHNPNRLIWVLGANAVGWTAYWGAMYAGLPFVPLMNVALGAVTGVGLVVTSHALTRLTPKEDVGIVFGMANMFVFLLITLCQWGTGVILGFFPSGGTGSMPTLLGFQAAYAAVILVMGASFIRWKRIR